jgi:transcriptional/translational regulatory protein YebC/TACO1
VVEVDAAGKDPEELSMVAIEAGADDISVEGDAIEVTTGPNEFEAVRDALEKAGGRIDNAEVTMHPKTTVPVGEDKAAGVLRLMEALEEDDDVQQVYANFDIPADVLERVSANV